LSMKVFTGIIVGCIGMLLLYGVNDTGDFPAWGDPDSPANGSEISQYYITQTIVDTEVPNMVTAVLADYRGYDTMFETVVIFVAGIAIFSVVRMMEDSGWHAPEFLRKPDLVPKHTVRLLVPVIQIFALYVLVHGHSSPGGGFQGGVIMGASYILIALVWDLETALKRFPEKMAITTAGVGILIYAGFGFAPVLMGEEFLNYGILHHVLPGVDTPQMARYYGMFGVEIGVMMTVSSVMFLIYALLASRGLMKKGL
jgi:multicomponent Na+:H+ antiporter subunit B